MANSNTIKAVVVRDFRDAGTEKLFAKDKEVDLEQGVFDNYVAAGLVRDAATPASEAEAKPAD